MFLRHLHNSNAQAERSAIIVNDTPRSQTRKLTSEQLFKDVSTI